MNSGQMDQWIIRCSNRILIPMLIKIMPPKISIFFPNLVPVFFPNSIPNMETKKVIPPMTKTARIMFISRKPKLIPTINASMLVAIDKLKSTGSFNRSIGLLMDESLKLLIIIFPPKRANKPKAIQ